MGRTAEKIAHLDRTASERPEYREVLLPFREIFAFVEGREAATGIRFAVPEGNGEERVRGRLPLLSPESVAVDPEAASAFLSGLLGVLRQVGKEGGDALDRLARNLGQKGIKTATIHSNRSQNQRLQALKDFKSGAVRVLVATDIAARGIDVDGISHVVNFDFPMHPEDYVHRIGRTGRAHAVGDAISFVMPEDRQALRSLERFIGRGIVRHKAEGFDHSAPPPAPQAPGLQPGKPYQPQSQPGSGQHRPGQHGGGQRHSGQHHHRRRRWGR